MDEKLLYIFGLRTLTRKICMCFEHWSVFPTEWPRTCGGYIKSNPPTCNICIWWPENELQKNQPSLRFALKVCLHSVALIVRLLKPRWSQITSQKQAALTSIKDSYIRYHSQCFYRRNIIPEKRTSLSLCFSAEHVWLSVDERCREVRFSTS